MPFHLKSCFIITLLNLLFFCLLKCKSFSAKLQKNQLIQGKAEYIGGNAYPFYYIVYTYRIYCGEKGS